MTQQANTLLTNALVLTMDKDFSQYFPGAVAVKDDRILAVGDEDEIKKEYSGKNIIDCRGKILMPGLINAHTHVPMTLLRGLADDLRLDVWLMGYMMPVEREFVSPDFVRLGTRLGNWLTAEQGKRLLNSPSFETLRGKRDRALLAVLLGCAHSYLGERYILVRLFRRTDLPKLFGGTEFTRNTLRFAWHLTTVLAFGFAGLLVALASPTPPAPVLLARTMGATFAACGLVALVGSRARHLSWVVFFTMAALTLSAFP